MAVVIRCSLDSDKRGEKYEKYPFVAIVRSKETQRSLEREKEEICLDWARTSVPPCRNISEQHKPDSLMTSSRATHA